MATAGRIILCMAETEQDEFDAASAILTRALDGIAALPVLPSEADDILTMSSRERHKWLKDGRLISAGTRTVKLRGRAKAVTFHVFDPRHIEDLLDGDLPVVWREEDGLAAAENRRRAAGKAALARAAKGRSNNADEARDGGNEVTRTQLEGWDAFEADGLLR